ncbi:MAG: hypothetical protein LBT41_01170 [Candidatus Methanoplasma sp.]|jgi:hypothetical protein|nr:hypothetical protein [Candidatus Methanoplasma sp.]
MEEYPDSLLRGIVDKRDQWYKEGLIQPALFKAFGKPDEEGWRELSINWYDCADALLQLLRKPSENGGGLEYEGGAAQVKREEVDRLKHHENHRGFIDYERDRLPDNEYHGNILFLNKDPAEKTRYNMICGMLASCAVRIVPEH